MHISVDWFNTEKTIIYYKFETGWTFREFNTVYSDVYKMLDTVDHKVHAIVDLTSARLFPTDTLREMRRLTFEQHKNGGITVIITQSPMGHSMYNFLQSIYKRFSEVFHLSRSMDDALSIIETYEQNHTLENN